jgi:hypothetical protein
MDEDAYKEGVRQMEMASTIIHLILCAIAKKGMGVVLDEMRRVNKLREWDDDGPVSAILAYQSALAGAALINMGYRGGSGKGRDDKDGGV